MTNLPSAEIVKSLMNSFVSVTASKLADAFTFTTASKQDSGNLTLEKLRQSVKELDVEIAQYQESSGKLFARYVFDSPIVVKAGETLDFSFPLVLDPNAWAPSFGRSEKAIRRPQPDIPPDIPMSPPTRTRMIDLGE